MKRVLLTGIAGFVGSHVLEYLLENTDWEIVGIARMSRAGNLNRLTDILSNEEYNKRVTIVRHDLVDPLTPIHRHIGKIDYVIHMAADSHVDDSISRPLEVFKNNSFSTASVLDYVRLHQPDIERLIYYSTDETYGIAEDHQMFIETDALNPRNPYSAGKAAGEMIATAYRETYGLPVLIMRTENMFGERQDPEKFVPKVVKHIMNNEVVPIHVFDQDGEVRCGMRYWLYTKNSASAILFMLEHGKDIQKVNVGSEVELSNLAIASKIADIVGVPWKCEFIEANSVRPGYDKRYSIDYGRISRLGWKAPWDFEKALEKTVKFSMEHPEWIK